MLMIYDYRVTVLLEESPQRAESSDHAIVADTSDHRGTVLRQSLECVKGCTLSRTSLLSARALTLREISLIAGTTLKTHPVHGIRLMRRTSHSPACSWTVWPPRIQSFHEVLQEDGKNLSEHAIDRMFPGQFCIKDWRSCANLEPSLARRLQPFTRNLMISMLMTGLDGSVLIVAGRCVLDAFNEVPWLAVAFCFAAIGLLLTLARIWFLTFRLARAN